MEHRPQSDSFWSFFAIRKGRDYFDKPILILTVLLFVSVLVEDIITRGNPTPVGQHLLISTIVGFPFLGIAFFLITRLDRLQSRLAIMAATDVLTNISNRRAFLADTQSRLENGQDGIILLIDADHFKRINDTYGHAVGDTCLVAIADRLRECVRADDLIGRLGGEEFGVFLAGANPLGLQAIAKRLTTQISVLIAETGSEVVLTLSLGAAEARSTEKLDVSISRADCALYSAKTKGRARMELWTDQLGFAA